MAEPVINPIEEARVRWIAGDNVNAIAYGLNVAPKTVYDWRQRFAWPARKHFRPPPRPPRDEKIVALAQKLWGDGLPRPDIAALCGIALGTLAKWRARYHWPTRQAGHCGLPGWEATYRKRANATPRAPSHIGGVRNLWQAILAQKPDVPHNGNIPKWRCCDQLLALPACPTCHRRNPACVS